MHAYCDCNLILFDLSVVMSINMQTISTCNKTYMLCGYIYEINNPVIVTINEYYMSSKTLACLLAK